MNMWKELRRLKIRFPLGSTAQCVRIHPGDEHFGKYLYQSGIVVGYELGFYVLVLIRFPDGVEVGWTDRDGTIC